MNFTRRSLLRSLTAASIGAGTAGIGSANDWAADSDLQQYIILAGGSGLRDQLESEGITVLHELAAGSVYIAEGPDGKEADLQSLSCVSSVTTNQMIAVDDQIRNTNELTSETESRSEDQWDKALTDTFATHDITTGDGTTLAIIDSGVDHSHPDLEPVLDEERSRLFRDGRIYSGERPVEVRTNPLESLPQTETVEQPVAGDVFGHGSHVAGIAAAPRNDTGVTGTAPDATVVSLRSMYYRPTEFGFSQRVWTVVDVLLALDYAVEIGADVANLSLAVGPLSSSVYRRRLFAAFRRVIQYAIERGTVVVVAAGNNALDLTTSSDYVLPSRNLGVVNVAATGPTDKRSYISNYGDGVVDVAAPGGGYETKQKTAETPESEWGILSTLPEEVYGTRYGYEFATSMAAPQVAGLACLLRELAPDLHPRRVKQAIEKGAIELSGEYTGGLGAGRINVLDSMEYVP